MKIQLKKIKVRDLVEKVDLVDEEYSDGLDGLDGFEIEDNLVNQPAPKKTKDNSSSPGWLRSWLG